jgi:hypothetical protein
MFKNQIILFICSVTIGFVILSCNLAEENLNQNGVTEIELEEILPGLIIQLAYNQSGIVGRSGAALSRVLMEGDASITYYRNYNLTPGFAEQFWNRGLYNGTIRNGIELKRLARKQNASHYEAISNIILAHEFGLTTLLFGDIPFSQLISEEETIYPQYDPQESVLQDLLTLLDDAINLIDQSNGQLPGSDDLIYAGNMEHWKQLAYGLKARYLLYTSKRNPEHLNDILNIISNHSFQSLNDQANFSWGSSPNIENPLYTFNIYRPSTLMFDLSFIDRLMTNQDPRLFYYAAFDGVNWYFQEENNLNLYWSQQHTEIPILSYVELKFIEAEVLLKTGANKQEIANALYASLKAGFVQMGIDQAEYEAYLTAHTNLDQFESDQEILKHIINEAYVTYYGFGFTQIWTNYRRTGYPELEPTGDPNEWNPSGSIPQRFLYPDTERMLNTENVQEAMDRQNGALLDVPLWVFDI